MELREEMNMKMKTDTDRIYGLVRPAVCRESSRIMKGGKGGKKMKTKMKTETDEKNTLMFR